MYQVAKCNMFERGSSDIDWCEGNYLVLPTIAEFYNSFSNLPFLLLPLIMTRLWTSKYLPKREFAFMTLIGITSFWFHSTLSFAGQLADELSILGLLVLELDASRLQKVAIGLIGTVSLFIYPTINPYVLVIFTIPYIWQFKFLTNMSQLELYFRTQVFFATAVTCWVLDNFFCVVVQHIHLHAVWHNLMAVVTYNLICLRKAQCHKIQYMKYSWGLPYF